MSNVAFLMTLILLTTTSVIAYDASPAFSPDSLSIAFVRTEEIDASSVIVTSPVANSSCRVLAPGRNPQFNPDGMHLLYLVESPDKAAPPVWRKLNLGRVHTDIFIVRIDTGETTQLTKQGGASPVWSADGGEIAYVSSSGALCRLPITGGAPKRIANTIPCLDCLTWLPDWQSFAVTKVVKGKMARYAFSPPSRTPVRLSHEHTVPAGALAPTLDEPGDRMAYLVRKQIPEEMETFAGLELWAAWKGGRRKVADIPIEAPLTPFDIGQLSLTWSPDGKLIAAACAGKIRVIELATGKQTLISDLEDGDKKSTPVDEKLVTGPGSKAGPWARCNTKTDPDVSRRSP